MLAKRSGLRIHPSFVQHKKKFHRRVVQRKKCQTTPSSFGLVRRVALCIRKKPKSKFVEKESPGVLQNPVIAGCLLSYLNIPCGGLAVVGAHPLGMRTRNFVSYLSTKFPLRRTGSKWL